MSIFKNLHTKVISILIGIVFFANSTIVYGVELGYKNGALRAVPVVPLTYSASPKCFHIWASQELSAFGQMSSKRHPAETDTFSLSSTGKARGLQAKADNLRLNSQFSTEEGRKRHEDLQFLAFKTSHDLIKIYSLNDSLLILSTLTGKIPAINGYKGSFSRIEAYKNIKAGYALLVEDRNGRINLAFMHPAETLQIQNENGTRTILTRVVDTRDSRVISNIKHDSLVDADISVSAVPEAEIISSKPVLQKTSRLFSFTKVLVLSLLVFVLPVQITMPSGHEKHLSFNLPNPFGSIAIAGEKKGQLVKVQDIAEGIRKIANAKTGIPPSHWGHPEFQNLAFLYDSAVNALILYSEGDKKGAEHILDYFDQKLKISYDQVKKGADTNRIYGILKIFDAIDPDRVGGEKSVLALLNAINVSSTKNRGEGQLEWSTTPGPTAWLIYGMATVDYAKYSASLDKLKKVLQAMQAPDGGVRDGDRMPEQVHTEPHADAITALLIHTSNHVRAIAASLMSSQAVIDKTPWPKDAEDGWQWFNKHVFDAKNGVIHQGYGPEGASTIFATDCYTWTMAGPFGDRIQKEYGLKTLKKLSETLLHKGMVKITWTLPDGSTRTRMLFDFTDPTGQRVMGPVVDDPGHPDYGVARGGYHPVGSTEWTGGAVLAFQKNAVRFWQAGDQKTAIWFKGLADALEAEIRDSFYTINGVTISEYATGHNMAVGHGWRTPVAYIKDKKGKVLVQGGSPIGGWVALPMRGMNPFILKDNYKDTYNKIPVTPIEKAKDILEKELKHKSFTEKGLTEIPQSAPGIVEARAYNLKMWNAFVQGNYEEAIKWSMKSINEETWVGLAKSDNVKKQEEIGGLISYPWGTTFPNNEHYLHDAIWKYPLLNEIATAMWGLAASNFELGNKKEAKYWMKRIVTEIPLHQIAAGKEVMVHEEYIDAKGIKRYIETMKFLVEGYWNALVSWERNPGKVARDYRMGELYREILKEIGLKSAVPKEVRIKEGDVAPKEIRQDTKKSESTYVDRSDTKPDVRPTEKTPLQKTTQNQPKEETKSAPQSETIIRGTDGTWGGSNSFGCWKLGPFDLSKAKYLQLQFSADQAGTKILVRLLPENASPDSTAGLNRKQYVIPKDGKIVIPISEFPVSKSDLKNISQISVHSGNGPWNIKLDNKGRTATFDEIEIIEEGSIRGDLGTGTFSEYEVIFSSHKQLILSL